MKRFVWIAWLGATAAFGMEGPVPVSPGSWEKFTTIAGTSPTFSWGGQPGASAYELAVFSAEESDLEGGSLTKSDPAPALSVVLEGASLSWTPSLAERLEPGQRYAWIVRSVPDGVWSRPRFFEVSEAPSSEEIQFALEILKRRQASQAGKVERVELEGVEGRSPAPLNEGAAPTATSSMTAGTSSSIVLSDLHTGTAEPRTLYANSIPVAWAAVDSGGGLSGSFGVASVTNPMEGVYDVTLQNPAVAGNTPVVITPFTIGFGLPEIAGYEATSATTFTVQIQTATGTARDSAFSFVVFGQQ